MGKSKKDLKKMSRLELLELLVEHAKEIERLNAEILDWEQAYAALEQSIAAGGYAVPAADPYAAGDYADDAFAADPDAHDGTFAVDPNAYADANSAAYAGVDFTDASDAAMRHIMSGASQAAEVLAAEYQLEARGIIDAANRDAEAILDDARVSAEEIIGEAHAEAAAVIDDAHASAGAIIDDANEEASIIRKYAKMFLTDAKAEADQVEADAKQASDKLLSDTKQVCSDLVDQAQAEIDALFGEASKRASSRWKR